MPDWFLPLLVGAVIGAVVGKVVDLAAPPLVNRVRRWICDLNHWRRCRIGTRQKRADTISDWRSAPPDFLRKTLFRWYEADPQAWWSHLHRIHQRHRNRDVRIEVENLLWETKPAMDLRVGDKLKDGHVLGILYQGERSTEVRTGPRTKRSWMGGNPTTQVARGWCDQGPECPDCNRSQPVN